jgi:hypothetical protein
MDEPSILATVEQYLEGKMMTSERVMQRMFPGKKIPDLRVKWSDGGIFYCEVKSPQLVLEQKTNLYKHDTTISKLRQFLHTATQQFNSVNPNHLIPNVLVWTSEHFQLNWHNFVASILGAITVEDRSIRDLTKHGAVVRTAKDWEKVDIHIWLQLNDSGVYQQTFFCNHNIDDVARRLFDLLRLGRDGRAAGDWYEIDLS